MVIRVAFLGPTPPPVMGPAVATQVVLSEAPPPDIELIHLDTSDRRSLATLGRLDLGNFLQAFRMYGGLLRILATKRPRVVYIPISQTRIGYLRDSVLIVLAWLFRRRIVLHLRGGNFQDFIARCGPLLRGWVRWSLRRATGIIVLGECLKELFAPFIDPARIHVVPNGEDFPEFDGGTRRYAGRDDFHVVYLGNMIPLKGAGDLLEAAPAIVARHPRVRFTFAGAWRGREFRSWAENLVSRRRLGERIRFLGPVDRGTKTRLLKEADLFAFPSTREGHPWVIVEALAAGLPIVSCDAGCIRESVLEGRNGRIVPMRNPKRLAETICGLLDDPGKLERMARESRRHYEGGFTRGHFRRRLFDTLREAETCA